MAQFPFVSSAETRDLADDLRDLFADLDARLPPEERLYSGEFQPALDVIETTSTVEVIVDVSGVPSHALRVLFRGGIVVVAGAKGPSRTTSESTFHLVEREFGRFARAVRLNGAFDVQRARASLESGELTIILPRLADRRHQPHVIPITPPGERS